MNTQNSPQILMILKNMWTRVRTFLTDLFQGSYLVVYLGIRLLPLLKESSTGKTFFTSNCRKISLTAILMVIVSILTLKQQLINLFLKIGITSRSRSRGEEVTVEEFRSKALKAVDIYLKPEDERKPCMFVLDSLAFHREGDHRRTKRKSKFVI